MSDHLRKRRLDLSLRQKEVAKILKVNPTSIYNWENNRANPKVSYIPSIIEFLGYAPYEPSAKTTGEKITAYRRLLGLSRKRLARYLGIDPSTLRNWETGKRQPTEKIWRKFEIFFTKTPRF